MKTFYFNKYYKLANILSLVLIIISVIFLIFKGLNFGVDFKGGTLIEIRIDNINVKTQDVRNAFNKLKLEDLTVKKFGNDTDYIVKFKRSDLKYKLIRGNVDTRIQKLENGEFDAILLSKAGIDSLKLQNKITQEFSVDEIVPCAGQGIIAIQCKKNDSDIIDLLEKINDIETRILANAEREVLKVLEGDCDTAVGVFAKITGENVDLVTELFSVDGKMRYFIRETVKKDKIETASRMIGEKLKLQSKGSYKN